MTNEKNITAERLKQCRLSANETLEQIATLTKVNKSTVLRWENGETDRIKMATIQTLAVHYGVNPVWLMGADVPMYETSVESDDELQEYLEELKNRPEMRMLFSLAKGATKEDVEKAVKIIEALQNTD